MAKHPEAIKITPNTNTSPSAWDDCTGRGFEEGPACCLGSRDPTLTIREIKPQRLSVYCKQNSE